MYVLLIVIVPLSIIAYVIARGIKHRKQLQTVTDLSRGEWSERDLILKLINKCGLDPRSIYHDLYLQKPNGTYTQIDLAVALPQGIVVFEVKDYSGWLFGSGQSKYWMQILAYGKEKHQFYNPLWQNNSHIAALRESLLANSDVDIYNVVVFYGNCRFKELNYNRDGLTRVIYKTEVVRLIKSIQAHTPTKYGDKHEVEKVLSEAVNNGKVPDICKAQYSYAEKIRNRGNAHHEYNSRWYRK